MTSLSISSNIYVATGKILTTGGGGTRAGQLWEFDSSGNLLNETDGANSGGNTLYGGLIFDNSIWTVDFAAPSGNTTLYKNNTDTTSQALVFEESFSQTNFYEFGDIANYQNDLIIISNYSNYPQNSALLRVKTDGTLVYVDYPDTVTNYGAGALSNGKVLYNILYMTGYDNFVYRWDLNARTMLTPFNMTNFPTTSFFPRMAAVQIFPNKHLYVSWDNGNGSSHGFVLLDADTGAILNQWSYPAGQNFSGDFPTLCISPDETTAYYVGYQGSSPVTSALWSMDLGSNIPTLLHTFSHTTGVGFEFPNSVFNTIGGTDSQPPGPQPPPTLYDSDPSARRWIYSPQLIRWRSRLRGQRESYKTNLEMQQFLYDIRKLNEADVSLTNEFNTDASNLEFGISLSSYWSNYFPSSIYNAATMYNNSTNLYDYPQWAATSSAPVLNGIPGTQDIITRLNRLLNRMGLLEQQSHVITSGLVLFDDPFTLFDDENTTMDGLRYG